MSNNIVQLVDKNGNNIFPVAGSMAGDSVTTAMLQDGAVTSDKIDYTTSETIYTTATKASYVTLQTVDVHVKVDPSGKIATIWGRTQTTSSQAVESSLTIQTDLRPTSAINIIPPGIVYGVDSDGKMNRNMAVNSITLSTSGVLSIRNINWADSSSSNKCMSLIFPVTIVL